MLSLTETFGQLRTFVEIAGLHVTDRLVPQRAIKWRYLFAWNIEPKFLRDYRFSEVNRVSNGQLVIQPTAVFGRAKAFD